MTLSTGPWPVLSKKRDEIRGALGIRRPILRVMKRNRTLLRTTTRTTLAGIASIATGPAAAASDGELVTGVTNVGVGTLVIALAVGLLLVLVLRPSVRLLVATYEGRVFRRHLDRSVAAAGLDVLKGFILPGSCGGLIPINCAVLTGGGVICIRACPHGGTVFGDAGDGQWSRVSGTVRRRFMNPVIQNESRAAAIRRAVGDLPVASLVVFPRATEFPNGRPANVVTVDEVERVICKIEFDAGSAATVTDRDAAWLRLKAAALTDDESRKDLDAQVSYG